MVTGWRLAIGAVFGAAVLTAGSGMPAVAGSLDCQHRINGTEKRLLHCIKTKALWNRLEMLQAIADANPDVKGHGNRNTGTAGYLASVNYVAGLMQQAGYRVRIQSYRWKRTKAMGVARLSIGGLAYRQSQDWYIAGLSGSGTIAAPIGVPRGDRENDDGDAGCTSADFRVFKRGDVALLRRSACDFDTQVANAEQAGASGIILYNARAALDGSPRNRRHADGNAFRAELARDANIPVIGAISYALGASLATQVQGGVAPVAQMDIHTKIVSDTDYNLIADSRFGDARHTIVVDAHLDAIFGAGILDNGSGSATVLEVALNLANTPTRNRIRYIWFGGEEFGLLGSRYYTRALTKDELKKLVFDIDVDVTATPNYSVLIADPGHAHNKAKFPPNVVPDSQIGNREFSRYFHGIGIPARIASFGNDGTDSLPFSLVGVPNTGILTQQNCCKHDWEVRLWGGFPGNYEGKIPGHDGGCVDWPRRWCDNLSNNSQVVLGFVSKAVAAVVLRFANNTSLHPSH